MRKFNPDKELYKIQNGNKNKVIVGLCTLLLIVVVGYSFALYQVRHTNKLVFNTVSEFKKRDIYLSVLVNGETQNEFPGKEDGYAFSGYECDGDATVTFDPDNWMASVNSNGPDKCTIKFGTKNINYDTLRIKEDVLVDETNDANLRYIGATPSNYIWFNCSKYDDLTKENAEDEEHQCERWRIIGLMNNMTIVDEETNKETTNQSLVKIIRADKIGKVAWDDERNIWGNASLKKSLNEDYLNPINDGTWITSEKDEKYKPISTSTLNMIERVNWNIGGFNDRSILSTQFYKIERGTIVPKEAISTWSGKVALMYPSDYGFATSGSDNGDNRNQCIATNLYDYMNGCKNKNWLYMKQQNQFTLTPRSDDTVGIVIINIDGSTRFASALTEFSVNPSLYLKSNTQITSGQGTFDEPYIIVNN